MARLRREHHRLLGNGYCTRPAELDCAFESICETCTFFQTSIEFRPTLQAQHDDADDQGTRPAEPTSSDRCSTPSDRTHHDPQPAPHHPARRAARTPRRHRLRTVLNEAIETLARLRTPYWLGDSGVRLHALASLIAQAQRLLPDAVADARDQELTWDEIGQLLGLTGPTAARRYRQHTATRTET